MSELKKAEGISFSKLPASVQNELTFVGINPNERGFITVKEISQAYRKSSGDMRCSFNTAIKLLFIWADNRHNVDHNQVPVDEMGYKLSKQSDELAKDIEFAKFFECSISGEELLIKKGININSLISAHFSSFVFKESAKGLELYGGMLSNTHPTRDDMSYLYIHTIIDKSKLSNLKELKVVNKKYSPSMDKELANLNPDINKRRATYDILEAVYKDGKEEDIAIIFVRE